MAYTDINSEDRLVQTTFVYQALPEPPYTAKEKKEVADLVYRHIWQQSASGLFGTM